MIGWPSKLKTAAKSRTTLRAFTLVELLTVLAIVGLLAAIGFPVLVKAKRNAQTTECLANMRQLGVAFRMYLDDYDEQFPAAVPWGIPGSPATHGQKTIQEILVPFVPGGMVSAKLPDGSRSYSKRSVFRCPSDVGLPKTFDGFGGGVKAGVPVWRQTGCSYEYYAANQRDYLGSAGENPPKVPRTALAPEVEINGERTRIGAPLGAVVSSARKALLGDIWFWHLGDYVMPENKVAYCNTLFADGHAARVRGVEHLEARLQQLERWHSYTELD
ncbi:MAG: prepilin-type N-terminal cleavage/methylation domain-containing protein [Armatimonadota bacterium]|nr:prepilin-type N-terminal cleavage/methylation domain-containing protein [Armatimonadota bacterium]